MMKHLFVVAVLCILAYPVLAQQVGGTGTVGGDPLSGGPGGGPGYIATCSKPSIAVFAPDADSVTATSTCSATVFAGPMKTFLGEIDLWFVGPPAGIRGSGQWGHFSFLPISGDSGDMSATVNTRQPGVYRSIARMMEVVGFDENGLPDTMVMMKFQFSEITIGAGQ